MATAFYQVISNAGPGPEKSGQQGAGCERGARPMLELIPCLDLVKSGFQVEQKTNYPCRPLGYPSRASNHEPCQPRLQLESCV